MSSFKRIIICLDGTMQDGLDVEEKLNTNVYRIAKAINKADSSTIPGTTIHQIVAYFAGIGADESSNFQSLVDSATGGGLKVKIQEAYSFIQMNWSKGDEIFIFGFSRGAYTARMLAGLIGKIGILNRSDMENFPDIFLTIQRSTNSKPPPTWAGNYNNYNASTKRLADCVAKAQDQVKQLNYPFLIKCLACFDTVGAMGVPEEIFQHAQPIIGILGFSNTNLGEHVGVALHALALNETREDFTPIKFTQVPAGIAKQQLLKQCWFLGSHSDVGGGFPEHDLADIALSWIVSNTSTLLSYDEGFIRSIPNSKLAWGKQIPHNPRTGIYTFTDKGVRTPPSYSKDPSVNSHTNETYHSSVLQQLTSAAAIVVAALKNPSMIEPLTTFEELIKSSWGNTIIPALLHLTPTGPPPTREIVMPHAPPLSPPITPGLSSGNKPNAFENFLSDGMKMLGGKK